MTRSQWMLAWPSNRALAAEDYIKVPFVFRGLMDCSLVLCDLQSGVELFAQKMKLVHAQINRNLGLPPTTAAAPASTS